MMMSGLSIRTISPFSKGSGSFQSLMRLLIGSPSVTSAARHTRSFWKRHERARPPVEVHNERFFADRGATHSGGGPQKLGSASGLLKGPPTILHFDEPHIGGPGGARSRVYHDGELDHEVFCTS